MCRDCGGLDAPLLPAAGPRGSGPRAAGLRAAGLRGACWLASFTLAFAFAFSRLSAFPFAFAATAVDIQHVALELRTIAGGCCAEPHHRLEAVVEPPPPVYRFHFDRADETSERASLVVEGPRGHLTEWQHTRPEVISQLQIVGYIGGMNRFDNDAAVTGVKDEEGWV